MITLIGVAHVFDIADKVKAEIKSRHPAVVAVELDEGRYHSLKSGEKDSGDLPIVYRAMAFMQERMGEKFGVKVGSEMLGAVEAAEELGTRLALIDLPAPLMFRKLMDSMSFKEKLYLVFGSFMGLFLGKERVEEEVEKYQTHEKEYMDKMESSMPTVSRVLIDERNDHMAKNLRELDEEYGSIVGVVGQGHITGLLERLKDCDSEVEVVKLKDLQEKDLDKKEGSNTEVSFSYRYSVE